MHVFWTTEGNRPRKLQSGHTFDKLLLSNVQIVIQIGIEIDLDLDTDLDYDFSLGLVLEFRADLQFPA
ncbi:MAG: hypothetical protein ACPGGJ_01700, partial [Coraliomargarita sp.]